MSFVVATAVDQMTPEEVERRTKRWRFFRIVFAFVYAGIVLDIITTALGYMKSGAQYEQNPLGGSLIGHLGWVGLLGVMTLLCLVCYHSVRIVFWRMSTGWSRLINVIMLCMAAFRWLVVVTAVLYLVKPGK